MDRQIDQGAEMYRQKTKNKKTTAALPEFIQLAPVNCRKEQ